MVSWRVPWHLILLGDERRLPGHPSTWGLSSARKSAAFARQRSRGRSPQAPRGSRHGDPSKANRSRWKQVQLKPRRAKIEQAAKIVMRGAVHYACQSVSRGAMAQLVARLTGSQKVGSSSLPSSTQQFSVHGELAEEYGSQSWSLCPDVSAGGVRAYAPPRCKTSDAGR